MTLQEEFTTPLAIRLKVQTYAWGKRGNKSLVGKLQQGGAPNSETPYAELWLGAHPNGCAEVVLDQAGGHTTSLSALIRKYPDKILGEASVRSFGDELPFLMKVLSIAAPLSIQSHPDKENAIKLHERDAKHYPDANHKPELAIALTPVRLLHGFRELSEIRTLIDRSPELQKFFGPDLVKRVSQSSNEPSQIIKQLFGEFTDPLRLSEVIDLTHMLYQRLSQATDSDENEQLFVRLIATCRDADGVCRDTGPASALLMCIRTVPIGSSIYIAPNTLHAYLEGDLLECMANSDNVIRAGLTAKFQDRESLLASVDFSPRKFEHLLPEKRSPGIERFVPPVTDFVVEKIQGTIISDASLELPALQIIFCLEGKGSVVSGGEAIHLQSGQACILPATAHTYSLDTRGSIFFRAFIASVK